MYGSQSSSWLILVIIVAVVLLRLWRSQGARPVNPAMLVLIAAIVLYGSVQLIYFAGAGASFSRGAPGHAATQFHPGIDPAAIPFYAIGAILGLALGIVRARTVRVFRDATSGHIMQQGGAAALLIWVVLFAIRYGVQMLAANGIIGAWATPVTDVLLLLGTFSIIGRNVYMLVRYVQLSGAPAPEAPRPPVGTSGA